MADALNAHMDKYEIDGALKILHVDHPTLTCNGLARFTSCIHWDQAFAAHSCISHNTQAFAGQEISSYFGEQAQTNSTRYFSCLSEDTESLRCHH